MNKIFWFLIFIIWMLGLSLLFIPFLGESYSYVKKAQASTQAKEITLTDHKIYAYAQVSEKWDREQWRFFDDLITRESNWGSEKKNPKSSAYGIAQFLNSTWKTVGCEKTSDIRKQIDCTISYVEARHKTPQGAIKHHNLRNWY